MDSFEKHIALKPFLEIISDDCSKLTRKELTDLIIELAKSEPASRRVAFLQRFKALLPGHREDAPKAFDVQYLLDEVQGLKEDIEERRACIEEGDYEGLDDFDWKYSEYEEPDFVSEEQIESFENLFRYASDLFVNKSIHDAKKIYDALFHLLDNIAEYDPINSRFTVDIREERARYARCVYDAPNKTKQGKRFEEFAHAMVLSVPDNREVHIVDDKLPFLQDVIDAREDEMEGIQAFYREWKEFLEDYELNSRTASLLIEAVHHLEGIDGVAKMARTWGSDQPYGYLSWLRTLLQESELEDLITVSSEALQVLQPGNAREVVCDYLIEAGKILEDSDCLLKGYRQKFFSNPTDRNLLALQNEAWKINLYITELSFVLKYWAKQSEVRDKKKSLYVRSLLLAGKIDDAYEFVKTERSIGWSYDMHVGMVFAAIALFLVDWSDNALIIRELLAGFADKRDAYSFSFPNEVINKSCGFYEYIISSKDMVQIEAPRSKEYWEWVLAIGRNRIDHIVSHKHRNAYRRAAQILGALAEIYTARGKRSRGCRLYVNIAKKNSTAMLPLKEKCKEC